jgi:hypothetical protein
MANRSDRHLPNLAEVQGPFEPVDLIEVKVRGFPSGPRADRFMPIAEAEYINATATSPFRSFQEVLRSGAVHI